jgi:hypothetical protein
MLPIRVTRTITRSMEMASTTIAANTPVTRAMALKTGTLTITVRPRVFMPPRLHRPQVTPTSALPSQALVIIGSTDIGATLAEGIPGWSDIGRFRRMQAGIGWLRGTTVEGSS